MENALKDETLHYYETLPIHPQPFVLESFTSYLRRLAAANSIQSLSRLAPLCFPVQILQNLADYPPRSFGILPTISSCPESILQATTFFHLGRKFGRAAVHDSYRSFLSKSIAQRLRYCPYCLSERPFYALIWRFLRLRGCYEHNCQLLDTCAHCGSTMPLFALSTSLWTCPSCKGDLRVCEVPSLSEELRQQAFECSQTLAFLLSPQPWESSADNLEQRLGQQLALLREAKGLSLWATARESKIDITKLKNIEQVVYGYWGPLGIQFQNYIDYAAYLGVTMTDLFDTALLQKVERSRPGRDLCDEDAFERVQEAITTLKDRGETITQTAICKLGQLSRKRMLNFPQAYALLKSTVAETCAKEKERCSSEMLERVQGAVNQLKASGRPITKAAVGKWIGMDPQSFKSHPQVLALFQQNSRELFQQNSRYSRAQEDELLTEVEMIKRQLEEQGKFVTQIAIVKQVGKSRQTLMKYPRIRMILKEVAALSYHHRFGTRRPVARHQEEE